MIVIYKCKLFNYCYSRKDTSVLGDPHRINLEGKVDDGNTEGDRGRIIGFLERVVGHRREG